MGTKYSKSSKVKKAQKRYERSGKGKEVKKKYMKSEKGAAAQLRYYFSDKGTKTRDRAKTKRKLLVQCSKFLLSNPQKTPGDFFLSLSVEDQVVFAQKEKE